MLEASYPEITRTPGMAFDQRVTYQNNQTFFVKNSMGLRESWFQENDDEDLHTFKDASTDLPSADAWANTKGEAARKRLLQVLASRRRREVTPEVVRAERHEKAYFQRESSRVDPPVLALCPKGFIKQELQEEDLVLLTEEGEQGRVPFIVIQPKMTRSSKTMIRRPAVICLHSTGNSKETMRPFMEAYASLGYVAVGVDARNHGDRGHAPHAYADALVAAWKTGEEFPFIFDTVWDLIKLMDYLTGRPDIDPARIGMMGISLGGMHTWFAAAADPRIAVAVPLIGVQSFGWAVANEQWHARVNSIPQPFRGKVPNLAFEIHYAMGTSIGNGDPSLHSVLQNCPAAQELGKSDIDAETVAAVWQRLSPGIMDFLDSPQTVPAIAPRPLLIHNGKKDPRCPVEGLKGVLKTTSERYKEAGVSQHFKFIAEDGLGHDVNEAMGEEVFYWFNKFLGPGFISSSPYLSGNAPCNDNRLQRARSAVMTEREKLHSKTGMKSGCSSIRVLK